MRYIDTHCHLEEDEFRNDLDDVIQRASEMKIHVITSATRVETWDRALAIASGYLNVSLSLGLDPMNSYQFNAYVNCIQKNSDVMVAVGEVGLDYYRERDHSKRDEQKRIFRNTIIYANELGVPLQVHSRSAGRYALELLEDAGAHAVHMHAFDGKASLAKEASYELGYYFSIPTSIVRSQQKRKLVKAIHPERLLLETDSPVLSPTRSERNEPANITIACQEIASILRRNENEIQELCKENTLRLYHRIRDNS